MTTFYRHVNDRVSERRWGLILLSQDSADDGTDSDNYERADISALRNNLYIPLSPQKP